MQSNFQSNFSVKPSLVVIAKTNEAPYRKSIHLTSSDIGPYFYQSELPEQPIPSLIHTGENLKKYLKAIKSNSNFNAYDIDRLIVLLEQFMENEGFGSTILRRYTGLFSLSIRSTIQNRISNRLITSLSRFNAERFVCQ